MFKEGDLTLPIPGASRTREKVWIEVFLCPRVLSFVHHQLRKQHPLLVLSDQERNQREASLKSWSEERVKFLGLIGTQFPQERGCTPMIFFGGGEIRKRTWPNSRNNWIIPFLGWKDQGGLFQLAPQNLPSFHTVNIFISKARREESKKQYFSSHAKNWGQRGA